jgi:hypothetical protein
MATASPGKWRVLTAFAVLPVVNAVLAFIGFPIIWWLGGHGGFQPLDSGQAAGGFAMLVGVLGLLVTMSGAMPVVFWLMKRGPVSFRQIRGLTLARSSRCVPSPYSPSPC